MPIKCFWLEPTDREKRYLRRYAYGSTCAGPMSYHDAMVYLDESTEVLDKEKDQWIDSGQTAKDFEGHALGMDFCKTAI